MAAAEPSPSNRKQDLITEFRERYATALLDAKVSVEHTATEGWQHLYAGRRVEEQKSRHGIAVALKQLAERLEEYGLSEEEEKQIGDAKKLSAAVREQRDIFELQTIGPVRRPVVECEKIANEARNTARVREAEAPLLNVGLEELMRMEVAKWDRPHWDADTGRVEIEPAE